MWDFPASHVWLPGSKTKQWSFFYHRPPWANFFGPINLGWKGPQNHRILYFDCIKSVHIQTVFGWHEQHQTFCCCASAHSTSWLLPQNIVPSIVSCAAFQAPADAPKETHVLSRLISWLGFSTLFWNTCLYICPLRIFYWYVEASLITERSIWPPIQRQTLPNIISAILDLLSISNLCG